jgi:hypothetical protein
MPACCMSTTLLPTAELACRPAARCVCVKLPSPCKPYQLLMSLTCSAACMTAEEPITEHQSNPTQLQTGVCCCLTISSVLPCPKRRVWLTCTCRQLPVCTAHTAAASQSRERQQGWLTLVVRGGLLLHGRSPPEHRLLVCQTFLRMRQRGQDKTMKVCCAVATGVGSETAA